MGRGSGESSATSATAKVMRRSLFVEESGRLRARAGHRPAPTGRIAMAFGYGDSTPGTIFRMGPLKRRM